jgi:hypothetical protein
MYVSIVSRELHETLLAASNYAVGRVGLTRERN